MGRSAGRVLISGAGVAGPALAFWLHRSGFDVTVVERTPRPRPGGQAVDLRGPAREVAARMGLTGEIRRAALRATEVRIVDAAGAPVATVLPGEAGDGRVAEVEILRGDLSRVLRDAADVPYVFGDRITALRQASDVVTATFARGGRGEYDLVIGADGVRSGVRALAFDRDPGCVHPMGVHVAYWSAPDPLGLDGCALAHEEAGRSIGIRPVPGERRTVVYVAFPAPPLGPDPGDVAAQKRLVHERAAGMGWEAPALLATLDDAGDFYLDPCSQVVLDSWSRGRIGLLGDAAFSPSPLSGQGTSLALVGAHVLAGELVSAGDPAAGLAAYERRLRPWVERTQRMGREGADDATLTAVANGFDLPDHPAGSGLDHGPAST